MKFEKLNGQALGTYMQENQIVGLDSMSVADWNRGNGWYNVIVESVATVLVTICSLLIVYDTRSALLGMAGICAVAIFATRLTRTYTKARRIHLMHQGARDELNRREAIIAAVFPGYRNTLCHAFRLFNDDTQRWYYSMDWTRAELYRLIQKIPGDPSAKGEFKVMFRIAKLHFRNDFDHNLGYGVFFTGQILEYMDDFKVAFVKQHV